MTLLTLVSPGQFFSNRKEKTQQMQCWIFLHLGWSGFKRIKTLFREADGTDNIKPCQWWGGRLVLFGSAELTDWAALSLDSRCSLSVCMCALVCIPFIRELRPGYPVRVNLGLQAPHLAACQETLQNRKNVWTLSSLWFKGRPGFFCLGCCDTIYTSSCPAVVKWAEKQQQIFNPRAQEKHKRSGSRRCWQKFSHGRVFTSFRQCLMIECILPYRPFPSTTLRDTRNSLNHIWFWLWPTKTREPITT